MRRVVVDEAGAVRLEEAPAAPPAAGQLAIRASCSLISPGTELHYIEEARRAGVRRPLGYCAAGVVEEVGDGVPGFARGDRVIAMGWEHAIHAERVCVPYRLCARVANGVAAERAVFAGLAATALHAVHRAGLRGGERILVAGVGLVGQLVAQCARGLADELYVSDLVPSRLAAARAAGAAVLDPRRPLVDELRAATAGRGVDVVFVCVRGEATALLRACAASIAARPDGQRRGAIVAVGRFTASVDFSVELGNLDLRYSARCGAGYRDDDFVHGRAERAAPPGEQTVTENLAECLQRITEGGIDIAPIHSHRLPFAEAPRAYALFSSPEHALGVTLHHDERR